MLLERGIDVRAFTRRSARARDLALLGVEIAVGDFDDPSTVEAAATGCEAMFLVSADSPSQVAQEVSAATAAHEAGVRHVVKLSSSDAGQRPYIWSRNHGEIEAALARYGVPHSVIRPHFFMQNYLSLLHRTGDRTAELRVPGGDGKIGAIDAHDIARVAAALLERGEPTYTRHLLTGSRLVSFGDVAAAFSNVTGYDIAYVDQPETEFVADAGGTPEGDSDVIALFAETREGGLAILSDEVERITGTPPRTIDEFAAANRDAIMSAVD